MDIAHAKQQVKDAIEAYSAVDEQGQPLLEPSKQRPVFLVGAPGIGKTAIIAQIAEELGIGLVSYSMTHHTRQSALGLPFIVHESFEGVKYEASEYTMSEIIASVYDYMRATGIRRGILFLDEINCVSETLYPSMLQFLQFKTFGRHKVPDGWVVACAGNPPEYNKSVHEFDIVTLDRVKKIVVEPDFDAWKAYALAKGIHPAIMTFLDIKKNRFYSVEATLEGKSFVTARGWDDLSEIVSVFERLGKPVDYDLIVQYVQSDSIAREFAAYYDLFNKYREDYRIEEILQGGATPALVERASAAEFDERLSVVGLLLDAVTGRMADVVEDTDSAVALRDILRSMKATLAEGGKADAAVLLDEACRRECAHLESKVAANVLSREHRHALETRIAFLEELAAAARAGDPENGFARVEAAYAARTSELIERSKAIESQLACAFSFLDEAFGDAQEVLVFTTELTSRTVCARYVAQYGSQSYFDHNSGMLLSERQQILRHRVEELEV